MTRSHKAILSASAAAIAAIGAVDQTFGAAITPGDLVVFQKQSTTATGANIQILELTPSGSSVQTITDTNLYADKSATEGYLSISDGGSEISYNGYTAQGATQNTITTRAVGVLNPSTGTISYPANTTYTATSGNNARSAYSADGTNWYEGDATGLFYNNGSNLFGTTTTSIHSLVNFGGTTYTYKGSTVYSINPSAPNAGTTSASLTTYATEPKSNPQDFTFVSSASNGTYDTLYLTDTTGNGLVYKYFNGSADGSVSFTSSTISGQTIEDITSEVVGGQVELFFTTDSATQGFVWEATDTATTISGTLALTSPTLLYSAPAGDLLAGIQFVPEPASIGLLAFAGLGMLRRPRRRFAV